jgi:hypothetical protein
MRNENRRGQPCRTDLHRHQHHFRSRDESGHERPLVGASGNICCPVVGGACTLGQQLTGPDDRRHRPLRPCAVDTTI